MVVIRFFFAAAVVAVRPESPPRVDECGNCAAAVGRFLLRRRARTRARRRALLPRRRAPDDGGCSSVRFLTCRARRGIIPHICPAVVRSFILVRASAATTI